jgi:hypothetical protein
MTDDQVLKYLALVVGTAQRIVGNAIFLSDRASDTHTYT